jgi:general secretion pathway protein D
VSKVQAAKQLLLQLMYGRPQVGVEVDLIDSTRRANSSYGVDLMNSTALAVFGRRTGDTRGLRLLPSIPAGFTKFMGFGGGRTFLGLGVADMRMFASMSESESRSLLRASLRALDGTPATLHIGEKYPILTLGYFGAATGEGQVYTPPPSVNFEDLGLVLKITPRIHSRDDISMLVEAEYKALAGGAINGIPIINNRKLSSVVRLKSGETAVLAGLVTVNEARTLSGVAGLSQRPMLGPLLRQNTRSRDVSEALMLIRPHVLDLPPTEFPAALLYTGTEGRPASLL